jgi:serine/threonine protein kinase/tetratricopeptide (TPR) repeat protein
MKKLKHLGNYQILRQLGQGGYAIVYLGLHRYLSTPAAIKVLHTSLTLEDQRRFLTEARTIAHLEHPHIVRILDFGIERNTPYLVMEYAPLGTVRTQYPEGTRLELDLVIAFVKQLAEALQNAHDQHLIHRDVKPDNMLLRRSKHLLLSDFGIAIASEDAQLSSHDMPATIEYSAPEQLSGQVSPASDQYSLGITVYEWLTGERPFQGTRSQLLFQHQHAAPLPLSDTISAISPSIEAVVGRALAKDPRARWSSVQEFASALEQAIHPVTIASVTVEHAISSTSWDPTQKLSSLWNVPHPRNSYFTGREHTLKFLHDALQTTPITALTQPRAISGLGGIGKTQTALEYVYRFRDQYQWVFWMRADSRETLLSDMASIATLLNLPEKDEQDTNHIVIAVKQWLDMHSKWLLVFDNVEDITFLSQLLPTSLKGCVLLTSRSPFTAPFAQRIDLEEMTPEEATVFLLRRAKFIDLDLSYGKIPLNLRKDAKEIAELLDGLPLALDQAGAYIEESGCSLSHYLQVLRLSRAELLQKRGDLLTTGHPESVAATLSLSFDQLLQHNLVAANLLRCCAFLAPDALPEEVLREIVRDLCKEDSHIAGNSVELHEVLRDLSTFSLIRQHAESHMISMHRLVQAVLKDRMDYQEQQLWAERAVQAVNRVFPDGENVARWETCQRLLGQVQVCTQLIDAFSLAFPEAARLLHQSGLYFMEHAQYQSAEDMLEKALGIRSLLFSQHTQVQPREIAETLNDLGVTYMLQQEYAKAEPFMQRALELNERSLGSESRSVAINTNNIASIYQHLGKYAEAEPLFIHALTLWEKLDMSESSDAARITTNLALLYMQQKRFGEAEPLYHKALTLWERVSGPEHPDIASTLINVSRLYREQGRYTEAEPLLLRSRSIYEKTLGLDHPGVAQSAHDLAILYTLQARFAEAEPLYQLALEIREQMLGADHPSVAETLRGYADMLRQVGRTAEADALLQRAEAIHPSE